MVSAIDPTGDSLSSDNSECNARVFVGVGPRDAQPNGQLKPGILSLTGAASGASIRGKSHLMHGPSNGFPVIFTVFHPFFTHFLRSYGTRNPEYRFTVFTGAVDKSGEGERIGRRQAVRS